MDSINGFPGHELKAFGRKLVGTYLRVGLLDVAGLADLQAAPGLRRRGQGADGGRHHRLGRRARRTAETLSRPGRPPPSYKFAVNCESRLFQRPDDAIHRGLDRQTEADIARPDNFLSNFEPLTSEQARALVDRITEFDEFTAAHAATAPRGGGRREQATSSARPSRGWSTASRARTRATFRPGPTCSTPGHAYIAERGMRLARHLGADQPLLVPVGAVLAGRRNNPPDPEAGIRPLAVYRPIHYQELPELFMDFICSLTGKSPSTTGAGSEGALTKGPFNALRTDPSI